MQFDCLLSHCGEAAMKLHVKNFKYLKYKPPLYWKYTQYHTVRPYGTWQMSKSMSKCLLKSFLLLNSQILVDCTTWSWCLLKTVGDSARNCLVGGGSKRMIKHPVIKLHHVTQLSSEWGFFSLSKRQKYLQQPDSLQGSLRCHREKQAHSPRSFCRCWQMLP